MWKKGRQDSGYFKIKLLESKRFKFDMYLLKMPVGSYINPHFDQVEGYEHNRLNFILKKSKLGGNFYTRKYPHNVKYYDNRIIKFRPDIELHGVDCVIKGTRYVLSIGWLRDK